MALQGTNGGAPGGQEPYNLATESCSVFVNGLSPEVTSETLKEVFGKVGKVASAVVMRDHFGASRGFGFVNYTKPDEADRAIQQFNKVPHRAGTWLVRKAEKRKPEHKLGQVGEQGLDLCNLFIRGLEPEISSIRLQSMFEGFGKVVSSKILVDPKTGASKCAGFLRFTAPEEAARAIQEMSGKQVGSKRLFVTLAQKRAAVDPQGGLHPPFEQSAQPSTPTNMAYYMPMPGMAAPPYPQGGHGHPVFPPYGMYPPGMVPMAPQAYQQGYGPPQLFWQGMPMAAFPGMAPGYQQADPRNMSRQQQQAQQYYMMTSGQDGTYFDMASNSFMHSGRGYRMPMGRGAAAARGAGRRGRQLFPDPPSSNNMSQPRAPGKMPVVVNSKPVIRRDLVPGTVGKDAPANTKDLLARLSATPDKLVRISMMGDLLFTLVQGLQPAKDAAKITGMLLEMTEPEILHILEDRDALIKKVDEALGVLKAAGYKDASPREVKPIPKDPPSVSEATSEESRITPSTDTAQSSALSESLEKVRIA